MIKATLPVRTGTFNESTKQVDFIEKDMDILVNTSVFAEEKWEVNFPNNAKKETLFTYIARIQENKEQNATSIISNLKAIYCFIDSNEITTFKDFCLLFDLSNIDYLNRLTSKLTDIFKAVTSSSTASPKN